MEAGGSGGAAGSFECVVGGDGVYRAYGADAAVAGEDLVAQVAGVGAETPLVDTVVAAEGAAAFDHNFEFAPAAEGEIVGPARESVGGGAASGKSAGGEHAFSG